MQIVTNDQFESLSDNVQTSVEVSDNSPGVIDLKEKKRKSPILSLNKNKANGWEVSCAKMLKLDSGPFKISNKCLLEYTMKELALEDSFSRAFEEFLRIRDEPPSSEGASDAAGPAKANSMMQPSQERLIQIS